MTTKSELNNSKEINSRIGAAYQIARLGFPVFPVFGPNKEGKCSCGGYKNCKPAKHPRINGWQTDGGRFRSWLSRVARNALIDTFRRLRPDAAKGGTSVVERLGGQPAPSESGAGELDREYRREVFRWAAQKIRCEFEDTTWLAFWMTTAEATPIGEIALQLGKTVGAVYTARSRVMRRLKEKVCEYENESE